MRLTLVCGMAMALALPSLAAALPATPAFPLKLLDAVVQDHVDRNGTIYSQSFQPLSVVATSDAITFPLKSHLLFASHPDVTVPAGTPLVEALYNGQDVYCGAFQQKAQDMNGASDVGFCLRDSGKTGTFSDITYLTPNPDAVLTAYEIHERTSQPVQWLPVHVGYVPMAIDDSLTGSIQIEVRSGLLGANKLYSKLNWPDRLKDRPDTKTSTAIALVWPGQKLNAATVGTPLENGVNLSPDLSASVTPQGDGYALNWSQTRPTGTIVISMTALNGSGMAATQYIYELLSREAK